MSMKLRTGIFAGVSMLILILDSKTALEGGIAGVQICMMNVIPALLPFLVLSLLISSTFTGADIPLLRPVGRLCRIPRGGESLLILGLLGGYPAGAQGVAQAYRQGQLTREDAQRLLGFCSNAGPAFLFGIASSIFPDPWLPWVLWIIHILSALVTGALLPGGSDNAVRLPTGKTVTLTQALEQAISITAKVCGWIILFRVFQGFLDRWLLWMLQLTSRVSIIGLMELANGCLALTTIPDVGLRVLLCSVFLSLGSLCVTMQTLSVTGSLGLGMYIPGKILQCTVSILLVLLIELTLHHNSILSFYTPILVPVLTAFLVVFSLVLHKYEKNCSNPSLIGV